MKNLLILALWLTLPLFTVAQDSLFASRYLIWSVKDGKTVQIEDIAQAMSQYDILFWGEEHDDSTGHFLEQKMLRLLNDQFGNSLTLSMEMFDRDVQAVMDEYLSGIIREKFMIKDCRAWKNYRDYKPMVELAKEKKFPVVCANAPTRYTNYAGRKGQQALAKLPVETQRYFAPLPYDTATGAYLKKITEESEHGPAPLPSKDTTKMAVKDTVKVKAPVLTSMGNFSMNQAQSLWDATMAWSILESTRKYPAHKIMQVNGRYHSDEGYGVATHLKKMKPEIKALIVSAYSDDCFPNPDWQKIPKTGDYIIITDPKLPKTYE